MSCTIRAWHCESLQYSLLMFTGIEWINFSSLPVDGNDSSPAARQCSISYTNYTTSQLQHYAHVQEMRMALPSEAMQRLHWNSRIEYENPMSEPKYQLMNSLWRFLNQPRKYLKSQGTKKLTHLHWPHRVSDMLHDRLNVWIHIVIHIVLVAVSHPPKSFEARSSDELTTSFVLVAWRWHSFDLSCAQSLLALPSLGPLEQDADASTTDWGKH